MVQRDKALIIGTFVLLTAVAAWGWMRKPVNPYSNANYLQPAATTLPVDSQASYDRRTPCATPVSYSARPEPLYASRDYVRTLRQSDDQAPACVEERDRLVARSVQPQYLQHGFEDRVIYTHDRSKKKSAAIVAGSAAGGAAIGAAAGGGKGAGIGALTGGVGGFVYDRLTHKH